MLEKVTEALIGFFTSELPLFKYYTFAVRFLLPLLAIVILTRCLRSLLRERYDGEEWGCLMLPNGGRITLRHWENIIGRSKSTDALMEYPTISRNHAALIRDGDGNWKVYDLKSKTGVKVNGKAVEDNCNIQSGDVISMGGVEMTFLAISKVKEHEQAMRRRRPGRNVSQGGTLFYLNIMQLLLCIQLCMAAGESFTIQLPAAFFMFTVLMWVSYIVTRAMNRLAFEVETIAFFLCTIGMAVCATGTPGEMYKQVAFILCGIIAYFAIGAFLRDLDRSKKLSIYIAAAGLCLLAVNLIFSKVSYGAKNWLEIGGFSLQPSEFVKIAFVFAGAATLDKMFTRKNLFVFIAFAAVCVIALALMSDFGTAIVFFVAYLVIAFLRSGDFATIFLSLGGTVLAGVVAISAKPYIAHRFATWGKAWLDPNDGGYQQVRTMAASASGGLFGVGAGNGWLKNIFAANTDMVFGVVTEEMGLIISLLCIAAILILVFFAIRSSTTARSSFYVIGACAALAIMMFQIILNVLGCLDILPFTGVTFPFVSKGGSSLIACWGLLAFVKACDTRQNASFTVKSPKKVRVSDLDPVEDFDDGSMYDDQQYGNGQYGNAVQNRNYTDENGFYGNQLNDSQYGYGYGSEPFYDEQNIGDYARGGNDFTYRYEENSRSGRDYSGDNSGISDYRYDGTQQDIYGTQEYRYDDSNYDDTTKLFDRRDGRTSRKEEYLGENDVLDDWNFEFPEDDKGDNYREDDR